MARISKRILAIDPGVREIGIAVLEGERLVYHGVETISNRASAHHLRREARALVRRLIRDFRPGVLAVEQTSLGRNGGSVLLNVLADEIRHIGKGTRCQLLTAAPSTVKKFVTGNGRAAKAEVAKAIVAIYPELKAYLRQTTKWRERYHGNMFDSVALGLFGLRSDRDPTTRIRSAFPRWGDQSRTPFRHSIIATKGVRCDWEQLGDHGTDACIRELSHLTLGGISSVSTRTPVRRPFHKLLRVSPQCAKPGRHSTTGSVPKAKLTR